MVRAGWPCFVNTYTWFVMVKKIDSLHWAVGPAQSLVTVKGKLSNEQQPTSATSDDATFAVHIRSQNQWNPLTDQRCHADSLASHLMTVTLFKFDISVLHMSRLDLDIAISLSFLCRSHTVLRLWNAVPLTMDCKILERVYIIVLVSTHSDFIASKKMPTMIILFFFPGDPWIKTCPGMLRAQLQRFGRLWDVKTTKSDEFKNSKNRLLKIQNTNIFKSHVSPNLCIQVFSDLPNL